MTKCTSLYKKYEDKLGGFFARYGSLVAHYPLIILGICVGVNVLLGLGLIAIKSESDAEKLYTPIGSQASKDRTRLQELFPDKSGTNFYRRAATDIFPYADIIVRAKSGGNILTNAYMNELSNLNNFIKNNITAMVGDNTVNFSSVCAVRSGSCVVGGNVIFSNSFSVQLVANNISYPIFGTENLNTIFAETTSSNGILTSAKVVLLTYYLRSGNLEDKSYAWEEQYIKTMKSYSSSSFNFVFSTSQSLNKELDENTGGDVVFFALTFALMLSYAGLATFGGNCVSNRVFLGQAGVFATLLSVLGSFGLVSAAGVEFVNIVGVMPFLLIGIGLDDMFILLSGIADSSAEENIEARMRHAMKTSGVAITITSLTDFLAFCIGAFSKFLSVRNFCLYTGVGVLFCYANQLAFFMPCAVLNLRMSKRYKHIVTCKTTKPAAELKEEGKSRAYALLCGGEPAKKRQENESPLETYPKILFKKIISLTAGKIAIVVVYCGYLGVAIWGCFNLQEGLELKNLVRDDSYYYSYLQDFQSSYPARFEISINIDGERLYSSQTTQNDILSLLNTIKEDKFIDDSYQYNWLQDYKSSALYDDSSEANFITNLKTYLNFRPDHVDSVLLNTDQTRIKASRFYLLTTVIESSTDQANLMNRLRDIVKNSPIPEAIVFEPRFIFFEQFAAILTSTLQTVGIAVATMFVITLVIMPHPTLVLLVLITLISILVGVFGFMYVLQLSLSSITMIHLVMSVGFSVDYSAHICHAFISGSEPTRKLRMNGAFDRAGGPIFNATASSLVGIIALVFARSYIFFSFFKMMSIVLLLGLLHAVFILPVLLLVIGPIERVKPSPEPSAVTEVHAKDIALEDRKYVHENKGDIDSNSGSVENEIGLLNKTEDDFP